MVWPDRTPKPAMWEHKALAAPVRLVATPDGLARGEVTIRNHQDWTGLDWLRARFELCGRWRRRPRGRPGAARHRAGRRARWSRSPALDGAPAGRPRDLADRALHDRRRDGVGAGRLRGRRRAGARSTTGPRPLPQPRAAADPPVAVDADGSLVHDLLASPPRLSLWRAPTDNDRIGGFGGRWTDLGVDRLERTVESVDRGTEATIVRSHYRTAGGHEIDHEQRLTTLEDGGVRVDESVVIPPELGDLARIGTTFEVVPGLERFEWFGTGPHETYPDRKRGGVVGRWASTVADQAVPYIRPQENGGHADVRWFTLTDAAGRGLRIDAGDARPGVGHAPAGGGPRRRDPCRRPHGRAPRPSSTSTSPTAVSGPRAAGRTRCPST